MRGTAMRLAPLGEGAARLSAAEWILDAGSPHLAWLYLGDRALQTVVAYLDSERSELWAGHVTALVEDDAVIGGYVAVDGSELARRRRADTTQLVKWTPVDERPQLRRRLELSQDVYLPVDPGQRFLSKIGVLPAWRGRGLGGELLDAFVRESFERGFGSVRLDVRRGSVAHGLYERRGFRELGARALEPLGVEYVAMTLERP
jgi:ribosomal protein S18 acetylase RimI-like enzyme